MSEEKFGDILIAVKFSSTLSELFNGTSKYFICNETFHYEKCELLRVLYRKCIFAASTESLESQ